MQVTTGRVDVTVTLGDGLDRPTTTVTVDVVARDAVTDCTVSLAFAPRVSTPTGREHRRHGRVQLASTALRSGERRRWTRRLELDPTVPGTPGTATVDGICRVTTADGAATDRRRLPVRVPDHEATFVDAVVGDGVVLGGVTRLAATAPPFVHAYRFVPAPGAAPTQSSRDRAVAPPSPASPTVTAVVSAAAGRPVLDVVDGVVGPAAVDAPTTHRLTSAEATRAAATAVRERLGVAADP